MSEKDILAIADTITDDASVADDVSISQIGNIRKKPNFISEKVTTGKVISEGVVINEGIFDFIKDMAKAFLGSVSDRLGMDIKDPKLQELVKSNDDFKNYIGFVKKYQAGLTNLTDATKQFLRDDPDSVAKMKEILGVAIKSGREVIDAHGKKTIEKIMTTMDHDKSASTPAAKAAPAAPTKASEVPGAEEAGEAQNQVAAADSIQRNTKPIVEFTSLSFGNIHEQKR